jgi:hypothetical protein
MNLALVQRLLGILEAGHGCPHRGEVALDNCGLLQDCPRVFLELSLPTRQLVLLLCPLIFPRCRRLQGGLGLGLLRLSPGCVGFRL